MPYKKVKSKFIIKIITKTVSKTTKKVVLSKHLRENKDIEREFKLKGIYIHEGETLKKYLTYNFIDYISKSVDQQTYTQEIFILVNSLDVVKESTIIKLAKKLKRVNIVTENIRYFKRLEYYLEKNLGIAITITNNKRKSLLRAKIIINMDFNEEMLNSFNINSKAIVIQMNTRVYIHSKLFNGINILDYDITYKVKELEEIESKKFNKKELYEAIIYGNKYENIIKKIEEDDVKIVNLIGKNGIINKKEYKTMI